MAHLARLSKNFHALFQPALDDARVALPLLRSVAHADCTTLLHQVRNNPELFFKKGQITDPDGQTFYNVSAYQLMIFLCDADMRKQVIPLLPKTFQEKTAQGAVTIETEARRKRQYAEIASGGADLVKMNRDPSQLEFVDVTRFKTSYTIDNQQHEVVFPLLENRDGIIFYQDATTHLMHLFYANKKTKTVTLIELTKEQRQALDGLFASFATMEPNSSRRSSNEEHTLIARTTQHTLSRTGILYEQGGVLYRDNRMQFNYINKARACIRLDAAGEDDEADAVWLSGVGGAQRQVLWLLARICERNRPFYPLPDFSASPFQRGFVIYNWRTRQNETVFVSGRLVDDLGRGFTIYKAHPRWRAALVPSGTLDGPVADRFSCRQLAG